MKYPHESYQQKKLRWFRAGARDFAITLPEVVKNFATTSPEVYCCPLCARPDFLRVFPEAAIVRGTLTAEDVPPKHSGGRPLALTCKQCNDGAGHGIDAAALAVERGREFLAGRGALPVRITAGAHHLGATLQWQDDGGGIFSLFRNRKEAVDGLKNHVSGASGPDREFQITFQVRDPEDHFARVSWLKSGFLAMFALFGYRYALHPVTEEVRRQIQEPKVKHIPAFSMRLPVELPFSSRRVFSIKTAELPPCWGVQIGPYLVFLPGDSSGELYPRIAELRRQGARFEYTTRDTVWPTQPLFTLAHRFGS